MTQGLSKRCAVYTRKSSEEGLEQGFNSLHAQREACEAFIKSQVGEGWKLLRDAYDDGGISGGTMERPALQKLLQDIRDGRVDIVVVYKVDRLTRSLADFAKMVEVFDSKGVSFVAVTQQFNTTSSMGRLTLNVLLSFAQFEREVTGERIRDKIAASKAKGIWMGGSIPLGYDAVDRALVVNEAEARTVREIYERYVRLKNVRLLQLELERDGIRSKSRLTAAGRKIEGQSFWKGPLYKILTNPLYIGQIRHKDKRYPGQHQAIIDEPLWEAVQDTLLGAGAKPRGTRRVTDPSPLSGKILDDAGDALAPSHAKNHGRRYRYYVSPQCGTETKRRWRLPAAELERVVLAVARKALLNEKGIALAAECREIPGPQIRELLRVCAKAAEGSPPEIYASIEKAIVADREINVRILVQWGEVTVPVEQAVAMHTRRRGIEARLVLNQSPTTRADPAIAKALGRAHAWFDLLVNGKAHTMQGLGREQGLAQSYVSRHIKLAFLAPDVIEALLDGVQPVDLTAETLVNRMDVPIRWQQQRELIEGSPARTLATAVR